MARKATRFSECITMPQVKVMPLSLDVRWMPSPVGAFVGALARNDIVEHLDTSDDQAWLPTRMAFWMCSREGVRVTPQDVRNYGFE
jgi:hypothetical protein